MQREEIVNISVNLWIDPDSTKVGGVVSTIRNDRVFECSENIQNDGFPDLSMYLNWFTIQLTW